MFKMNILVLPQMVKAESHAHRLLHNHACPQNVFTKKTTPFKDAERGIQIRTKLL
jgi:hypothetical protein